MSKHRSNQYSNQTNVGTTVQSNQSEKPIEDIPGEDVGYHTGDIDKDLIMPKDKPPLEGANDAVFQVWLQLNAMLGSLQRILYGPLAGDLRMAAAIEKCPFGGDARQFDPIKKMFKIIMKLNPRDGTVPGVVTDDPVNLKNPTDLS